MSDLTGRLDEIQARAEQRLAENRLGKSMARETDLDLLVIRDLLREVRRLQAGAEQFAVTLGFGYLEHAATLAELVEPIEQAFSEARDHFECPVICELCGEKLASQTCEKCHGSGCLPNAELAHLECDECAGVGKVHPGCVEKSYDDLVAEVQRLQAIADALGVEP